MRRSIALAGAVAVGATLCVTPIEYLQNRALAENTGRYNLAQSGPLLPPATPGAPVTGPAGNNAPQTSAPPKKPQQARPQPKAGSDGLRGFSDINKRVESASFPTAGYKFPVLMTAIYLGKFNDVPDDKKTRSLVFSVLKSFADGCGPIPANVTFAAMSYGSDQARQLNRNPTAALGSMLQDFVKLRDQSLSQGFVKGFQNFVEKRSILTREGLEDGALLLARHKCGTPVQVKFNRSLERLIFARSEKKPDKYDDLEFAALMSPAFRRSLNIPDPGPEMVRRKTDRLKKNALQSCQKEFGKVPFCDCAIGKLATSRMNANEWQSITGNFRAVVTLGTQRPAVMSAIRACYG